MKLVHLIALIFICIILWLQVNFLLDYLVKISDLIQDLFKMLEIMM